jgi:hypothetical protein
MATTFNWTIANTEYYKADGGIFCAHWRLEAVDGEHTASCYGTVSFTPDADADDFIAFDSLTEDTVIGWVQDELDTETLEANLQSKIDEDKNPTTAVGMPWAESV